MEPEPKDEKWYRENYRSEVPRTGDAVACARRADRDVVQGVTKLYGLKYSLCLDMCAEDRSVYFWSIFGPAEVDTYGLNEGRTYSSLLKIPSACYDAVSCFVSLEHCIDPALIVKAACQVLKSEGLFIASVPAVGVDLDVKPHHTWYWAGWSLQRMLKRHGFCVFASLEYVGILYVLSTRADDERYIIDY